MIKGKEGCRSGRPEAGWVIICQFLTEILEQDASKLEILKSMVVRDKIILHLTEINNGYDHIF